MSSKDSLLAHLHDGGDQEHLLREIIRTNQALINGFSRIVGMPASRLVLMRELANAPLSGIGVLEIARLLGINAAAITRLVKEMDDQGLIKRRADSRDARRTYITLSAKGTRTFEQLHSRGHELEQSLAAAISAEEMAVAVKVLGALRTVLEKSQSEGFLS